MDRNIFVFGMGHFSDPDELKRYIETDVFAKDGGRFDYSQKRDADVILLSLGGHAYGHFDIASHEDPSERERESYPTARAVYIVKGATTLYETPVKLLPLGVRGIQFGKVGVSRTVPANPSIGWKDSGMQIHRDIIEDLIERPSR